MSDEYEYGPWIDVPEGGGIVVSDCDKRGLGTECFIGLWRYRIATPKPKRELVVGKWYRGRAHRGSGWRFCAYISTGGMVWMTDAYDPNHLLKWSKSDVINDLIDWSTPPRDEAPNE